MIHSLDIFELDQDLWFPTIHVGESHSNFSHMVESVRTSLLERPGKRSLEGEHLHLPSASVCVIIKNDSTTAEPVALLLRRRVVLSDPWSGDMAFPGGRSRHDDRDAFSTALREVQEETGIDLTSCTMLGTLDDVVPGNVKLRVTPFVAIAPENTNISLDGDEIVDYIWIPVGFFLNDANISPNTIERFGRRFEVTSFNYLGKHVIWGMTFRILQDLASRLR